MRGETFRAAALATCAAAAAIAVAGEPAPLTAKVYKGGNGERVTVVRRAGGATEALVKVEGTDTRLDGRIFKVEVSRFDGKEDWFTYELGGTRYALVTLRGGYAIHPGEGRDSISIRHDEKASAEARPEAIEEEYRAKAAKTR